MVDRAPMLCQPAPESALVDYCTDPAFAASQKVDGRRLLVVRTADGLSGLNRRGLPTGVFREIRDGLLRCPVEFVMDGELMLEGRVFWVFDAPEVSDLVAPHSPYVERRAALEALFHHCELESEHVRLLPEFRTDVEKLELAQRVVEAHAEGLVFKELESRYMYGSRSAQWRKVKLVKSLDCIATGFGAGGHDNITVSVYSDGELVEVGEVTRQAGDGQRVQLGDVITVTYLSWSGSRLIQPTRPILRGAEKAPQECTIDQLVLGNTKTVLTP